jgi:hypothetical protein
MALKAASKKPTKRGAFPPEDVETFLASLEHPFKRLQHLGGHGERPGVARMWPAGRGGQKKKGAGFSPGALLVLPDEDSNLGPSD